MTKLAFQAMDSYRFAEYANQLSCYICGHDNHCDGDACRYCLAPMSLARQAATKKTPPRLTAVLGAAGTGKTVYVGMLADMLSRPQASMQMLERGAFSISLQQAAVAALSRCEFPEKTPNDPQRWNWLYCQVKTPRLRRPLDLVIPDMAGTAVLDEVERTGTYPVIRSFLKKCSSILLLVDAAKMAGGDQQQDFLARKIVNYLLELNCDQRAGWARKPIALVLAKADQCDGCLENPSEFVREHAAGLWQLCDQRLRTASFFAAGVAGACAHRYDADGCVPVPLRIEPRGIIEPFLWLVEQMPRRIKRR